MSSLLIGQIVYWMLVLGLIELYTRKCAYPNEDTVWGRFSDWAFLLLAFTVGSYFIITNAAPLFIVAWVAVMTMYGAFVILHLLEQ